MSEPDTMMINKVKYVREDSISKMAPKVNGLDYCMVRTYSAGVFAGYVESRNGKEVVILNSTRIWKWEGAASLSQLSTEGTNSPKTCKFGVTVDRTIVTEAIEIIFITEAAKKSIEAVEKWRK